MTMRLLASCLFTLSLLSTGCMSIEEEFEIDNSGGGTVRYRMSFPQLAMRWLPGKPSVDWLRPNLPPGVALKSFEATKGKVTIKSGDGQSRELDSLKYDVKLSFSDVRSLAKIRVRPDTRNELAAVAGSSALSPIDRMQAAKVAGPDEGPFHSISLKRSGDLLEFRRVIQRAQDPDREQSQPATTKNLVQGYDLRDSSLKIRIHCPGKIVKHNAHQQDGNTLVWVFKLKMLEQQQDKDWVVQFTCEAGDKS